MIETQDSSQKEVKHRIPKKLPVAISEEEFIKLIKATKKPYLKVAFLLGYGSGLRVSEVVKLESRNVNIPNKTILVVQGKGSKDRIVPMPKGFKEEHLKLLPMKVTTRCLQKAFRSACKRAGLLEIKPTLHFHSLRHGFGTHAISVGIPIHHLRTMMGHSNISTTNVYLESNPKEALKSFEELF